MINNKRCILVLVFFYIQFNFSGRTDKEALQSRHHKNTRWVCNSKDERTYHRLPAQTQGQTPIQYTLLFANFLFYYSSENKSFDVAHRVLNFMRDNKLKPSKELIEKYRLSKTTKTLNLFPSYEELKEKIDMRKSRYDELKKVYRRKTIKIKWE